MNNIFLIFILLSFTSRTLASDFSVYKKLGKAELIKKGYQVHPNGGGLISPNSKVGKNTFVGKKSIVFDNASLLGESKLTGESFLIGNARIEGRVTIADKSYVMGPSKVTGSAKIEKGAVVELAYVTDKAVVSGPIYLSGDNYIGGNSKVSGFAFLSNVNLRNKESLDYKIPTPNGFITKEEAVRRKILEKSMNVTKISMENPEVSIVTLKKLKSLYSKLMRDKNLFLKHPNRRSYGCNERANYISSYLEKKGVYTGKIILDTLSTYNLMRRYLGHKDEEKLTVKDFDKVVGKFTYHIAPFVLLEDNGKKVIQVIDPVFFDTPVTSSEWVNLLLKDTVNSTKVKLSFNSRFIYYPGDTRYNPKTYYLSVGKQSSEMKEVMNDSASILKKMFSNELVNTKAFLKF